MPSIDYFISSDLFEPGTREQARHAEQLLRFDSLTFHFSRPTPVLTSEQLENTDGNQLFFPNASAVYLIPQTLPKFHPDFDDAIEQILHIDTTNSLVGIVFDREKYHWKVRLRTRLENRGLDLSRIVFVPSVSSDKFQILLQEATLLLDPFPFGGGVTSLEAFALCKPVVTLRPAQTVMHLTDGMLKLMKMNELRTSTLQEFVATATEIRFNATQRSKLQAEICEQNGVLFESDDTINEWNKVLIKLTQHM